MTNNVRGRYTSDDFFKDEEVTEQASHLNVSDHRRP